MKTAQLVASLMSTAAVFGPAADAASLKSLLGRVADDASSAAAVAVEPAAMDNAAADAALAAADDEALDEDEKQRRLNCWGDSYKTKPYMWHPQYAQGWTDGYCRYTKDCNSPGYSSQLACCKGAYAGQISGACVKRLPSPPTSSPTGDTGTGVFYPDYDTAWTEAGCIRKYPIPSGRPTYKSMLACCKGAYGGQVSGYCLSKLPSPPTTSPTPAGGLADFWYPDYDTAWTEAGCMNKLPLPYPRINDRPNYKTQLECCKRAYGGQMSGACLSQLPNPPTTSPTKGGGLDFFYPDYDTAWSEAGCINTRPFPGGRPTYKDMISCCKGAYGGQVSGTCLAALPSPPTTSPTTRNGLTVFYPDYSKSWPDGVCINDRPMPSGRPTYSDKESCCSGAYGGQTDHTCACDADPCYSCKCGSVSALAISCPALDCGDDDA